MQGIVIYCIPLYYFYIMSLEYECIKNWAIRVIPTSKLLGYIFSLGLHPSLLGTGIFLARKHIFMSKSMLPGKERSRLYCLGVMYLSDSSRSVFTTCQVLSELSKQDPGRLRRLAIPRRETDAQLCRLVPGIPSAVKTAIHFRYKGFLRQWHNRRYPRCLFNQGQVN